MNNEPVAYVNSMCNDYIDWKVEPMSIDGQSLYTHPVKEQKLLSEIEALQEALKQVVKISDRKHDAWDKAKELLK